ncbi:MAG TPA: aminoacyl-tRNA hydrolase [bacterium]|jgi:PTH1 family peptidyl-tRNA hydrolase
MKLIAGLGNPGRRYRGTRHNVGWEVVDRLAHRWGTAVSIEEGWSLVGRAAVGGRRVLLAKPQTYVNVSGIAIADLRRRHRIPVGEIFLIVDDLDLPLGRIRLRTRGTHGGHNGLRSVIEALGSEEFPRLRIGIGRPPEGMEAAEFVLTRLSPAERPVLDAAVARAADALETAVLEGPHEAMNRYNASGNEDTAKPGRERP